MKTYKGQVSKKIVGNNILVYGSNTQGRHGKGSALLALKEFGAQYGKPKGLHGRSYGIVTKDLTKRTHPSISKEYIEEQIRNLYLFAIERPEWDFYVPYNCAGKNLNNYTSKEMAQMFSHYEIPGNIVFEEEFSKLL